MSTGLGLDRLTPSRKDDWKRLADAPPRIQPTPLRPVDLAKLTADARERYDDQRAEWHANLSLKTPQLAGVHADLWDIVDSNRQDGDRVKGAAAIDAFPGLGKTT